jgi:hypothetical protein
VRTASSFGYCSSGKGLRTFLLVFGACGTSLTSALQFVNLISRKGVWDSWKGRGEGKQIPRQDFVGKKRASGKRLKGRIKKGKEPRREDSGFYFLEGWRKERPSGETNESS